MIIVSESNNRCVKRCAVFRLDQIQAWIKTIEVSSHEFVRKMTKFDWVEKGIASSPWGTYVQNDSLNFSRRIIGRRFFYTNEKECVGFISEDSFQKK